jgi:hypothetical protein
MQRLIHSHWVMKNFIIIVNDKESVFNEQTRKDLPELFKSRTK